MHVDKAFWARKSWLQELTYSAINRISQAHFLHGLESGPRINWPLLCKVSTLEQEINIKKCNEWLRKHFNVAQSLAGWITEICRKILLQYFLELFLDFFAFMFLCLSYNYLVIPGPLFISLLLVPLCKLGRLHYMSLLRHHTSSLIVLIPQEKGQDRILIYSWNGCDFCRHIFLPRSKFELWHRG